MSALSDYVRKVKKRERTNQPSHKSGKQSLKSRVDKELLEKLNWFKKGENDFDENLNTRWRHYKRRKEAISLLEKIITGEMDRQGQFYLCKVHQIVD